MAERIQSDRLGTAVLRVLLEGYERVAGVKIEFTDAKEEFKAAKIVLVLPKERAKPKDAKALEIGCFTHFFDTAQLNRLRGATNWKPLFTGGALQEVVDLMVSGLRGVTQELDPVHHTAGDGSQHASVKQFVQGRLIVAVRVKPGEQIMRWNLVVMFLFLCVSQQGEFKNAINNFLGEIHVNVKNFWRKKLRGKKLFSCRLFPSIFLNRVFGRFSA
jgi:hypothetical protein